MEFYVGISEPSWAHRFARCFISINRLRRRKGDFKVNDWILDSGAFTHIAKHGEYTTRPRDYAVEISRWAHCGNLIAACSQDFMCEPFMFEHQDIYQALEVKGTSRDSAAAMQLRDHLEYVLSENGGIPWWEYEYVDTDDLWTQKGVRDHQEQTVSRYAEIHYELRRIGCRVYLMPVLQGYEVEEYLECIRMYESAGFLPPGAYVGVGSVCKRNANVDTVEGLLGAIALARPDLRLHGFGLKVTALKSEFVRQALASSDSMAWSLSARKQGRNQNCWTEAEKYRAQVQELINQDDRRKETGRSDGRDPSSVGRDEAVRQRPVEA